MSLWIKSSEKVDINKKILFFLGSANHLLTIFKYNLLSKTTDAHTCYKMIDHNLIKI